MSNYIIGYDLNRPRGADDYPKLIEAIKKLGSWWHHLDSTWIVATTYSAVQIRDQLAQFLDSGDELLVARLSGEAAWTGIDDKGTQWLKTTLS